jgi:CheY-like chemotaxis protein
MSRVLIIDDDEHLLHALALSLRSLGYLVATATDGAKAAKLFRSQMFDVIVTDLVMPNREGVETIITLRQEFPHIGVIAMTGSSTRSELYLELAARVGADRTLAKPFKLQQLDDAIRSLL